LSRDKSSGSEVSEFGKSPAMNRLRRSAQLPDFAGCPALSGYPRRARESAMSVVGISNKTPYQLFIFYQYSIRKKYSFSLYG
ncbi:MAG: hypothetical protein D3923_15830, partial [Candidatus Electrothrix sp. AR3]|nr:hypothetical protein [Candidatus Electrothrix sp. AR3]